MTVYQPAVPTIRGGVRAVAAGIRRRAARSAEIRRLTAQVARLREELAEAGVDLLTGLAGRRAWTEYAARMVAAPGEGTRTYVLLLDLTDFKKVNDSYGHVVGDELLRVQARRLCHWVRGRGRAGRFGGDELVAVIELDPAEAARELESLSEILRAPMAHGRFSVAAPAAIGVAEGAAWPLPVLLHAADQAMYRAKASGPELWWLAAEPAEYAVPRPAPALRIRDRDRGRSQDRETAVPAGSGG